MNETSAAAGRCDRLLICTRFHGPGATHSSFRKEDYRAGQMASRMHLHSCCFCPPLNTTYTQHIRTLPQFKTTAAHWKWKKDQLKAIRWHLGKSLDWTDSYWRLNEFHSDHFSEFVTVFFVLLVKCLYLYIIELTKKKQNMFMFFSFQN